MALPSTAITRLDLSLSYGEVNLAAAAKKFIGLRVLPGIGVDVEGADFAKIVVEQLKTKVEDTERKPRSTYAEDTFEWTTDNYALAEHGVVETVDDASIEKYGDVFRAETIATQRAVYRILSALENAIAGALFTSGFTYKTAVSTPWSTHASATPINDIHDAIESVKTQLGEEPNALVLSDLALRHFKQCAEVEDLLKYSGHADPHNLGILQGLKDMFELEHVHVGKGMKNTADRGQNASFSRYWDQTMAGVYRIVDDGMDGDLENPDPHIGRTIFKNDEAEIPGLDGDGMSSLIIEEYRQEDVRGGKIRARNKRQVKILHNEAGHLMTGVTA